MTTLLSAVQNCNCFVLHAQIDDWGAVSGLQISSGSSSMIFVFPYHVLPYIFTFSVYIHGNWTLGKSYGIIKSGCYWEHLQECIWELNGNMLRTHWVWGKNEKKPSLPKIVCHYFCPMLTAGPEFWGHSVCVCVMHLLYQICHRHFKVGNNAANLIWPHGSLL